MHWILKKQNTKNKQVLKFEVIQEQGKTKKDYDRKTEIDR